MTIEMTNVKNTVLTPLFGPQDLQRIVRLVACMSGDDELFTLREALESGHNRGSVDALRIGDALAIQVEVRRMGNEQVRELSPVRPSLGCARVFDEIVSQGCRMKPPALDSTRRIQSLRCGSRHPVELGRRTGVAGDEQVGRIAGRGGN